ncbi:30S ribosomal protein S6 [Anaerolineales bacterium HSG6]|nr:30S ribosomal protein S6 [Anaerolineales bacterium HSG6]MDM8532421.1 30S ribosomal protein S6 [Anaerolineales bacterium HSG25]
MRMYELAFIVKPNVDDDGLTNIIEKVSGFINSASGEITTTNVWGRRRLAYPIKNYREGTYVLFEANLLPSSVKDIEWNLKLTEDIIRYLMFKKDE